MARAAIQGEAAQVYLYDRAKLFGQVLKGLAGLAIVIGALWFFWHRGMTPFAAVMASLVALAFGALVAVGLILQIGCLLHPYAVRIEGRAVSFKVVMGPNLIPWPTTVTVGAGADWRGAQVSPWGVGFPEPIAMQLGPEGHQRAIAKRGVALAFGWLKDRNAATAALAALGREAAIA